MEREFTIINGTAAIGIAFVYIILFSLIKEPNRQKLNAVIIAGAGSVYWSGGLGVWEYTFGTIMLLIAFKGLTNYKYLGVGWLLHSGWDILHVLYGHPIISFVPTSSMGCAVCDPIIAIWFFLNAPSIFYFFNKQRFAKS